MKEQNKTNHILSTLWIVIMINMIFNDIFSIMVELVRGNTIIMPGEVTVFMLIAAVITNIPILMIIFSLVLKHKINRILNIAVGIFTIAYVIAGGSLLPHYILIATIEVVICIFIIVIAWRWRLKQ